MKTIADVTSQRSLLQLAKVYSEKKSGQGIVFFIGSGLSKPAKLPDWAELRSALTNESNKIVTTNAISESNYGGLLSKLKIAKNHWEAFSLIREILGRTTYTNRIRELLRFDENIEIPSIYKRICKLDVKGIISLNIDDLLARALAASTDRPVNSVYGKSANEKLELLLREKPYIYQPHGHVASESSWVFTVEDFQELLSSAIHDEFLTATFLFNTVVFLGISADDIGASGRLVNLSGRGILTGSHYWIATDSPH